MPRPRPWSHHLLHPPDPRSLSGCARTPPLRLSSSRSEQSLASYAFQKQDLGTCHKRHWRRSARLGDELPSPTCGLYLPACNSFCGSQLSVMLPFEALFSLDGQPRATRAILPSFPSPVSYVLLMRPPPPQGSDACILLSSHSLSFRLICPLKRPCPSKQLLSRSQACLARPISLRSGLPRWAPQDSYVLLETNVTCPISTTVTE